MTQSQWIRRVGKPAVFILCLTPLFLFTWNAFTGGLSANPIDDITDLTGTWTLRFLMITLAVTPIRRLTGWNWLLRFRRMLGLFAFFYGSLHFTTYIYLDQFFDWNEIVRDVAKRPFITVGFLSFTLLIPLAITSFNSMMKRLGARRWGLLHRLVYVIALGGVVHYLWLVKADISRPLTYGLILSILLGLRIFFWLKGRFRSQVRSVGSRV